MPLKYTRWNDVELEHLNPQLDRQMITGENLMIARVLLKKGVIVPEHSHENEQLTYILEGALIELLGLDVQIVILGTGDQYYHDLLSRLAAHYPKKLSVTLGAAVLILAAGMYVFDKLRDSFPEEV
jgi:hypothetical protein